MVAALPVFKLGTLMVRQLAKPLATALKEEAKKRETLTVLCKNLGEYYHQGTSRLNLLASGYKVLQVKPLPADEALASGIGILSEGFIFSVAVVVLLVEYYRSERQAAEKSEKAKKKEEDFVAALNLHFRTIEEKIQDLDLRFSNVEKLLSEKQQEENIKMNNASEETRKNRSSSWFGWNSRS